MSKSPKFLIRTYGCQMNVRDSEAVEVLLVRHGWEAVSEESEADLIIVNTCSVRGKAEDKALGKLGLLTATKREYPDRIVGVMGCMVQRMKERLFSEVRNLDFAVGPRRFSRIPMLVERIRGGETQLLDAGIGDEQLEVLAGHEDGAVSAFVNILLGCDRRCAYCIVPDVRGPEWSRPSANVIEEVRALVSSGVREVTLLGQSVMRYGVKNPVWPNGYVSRRGLKEPFARLLEAVNDEAGISRLRFTSSHPSGCTDDLVRAMVELDSVCPHLHLPLQSGSDGVLARMRRGYDAGKYLAAVNRLRTALPGLALTTDIIVGFPGEADDDFEATREVMEAAAFDNAFIFKYSPRPGTPAAEWEDDVPDEIKKERNKILLEDQDKRGQRLNERYIGQTVEVLVEGPSLRNSERWSGRSRENKIVVFASLPSLKAGELMRVKIHDARPQTLYGDIVES